MIVKAYVVLAGGATRRCRADAGLAGSRQADHCAVQISARDRVCRATAEDRDRQAESALRCGRWPAAGPASPRHGRGITLELMEKAGDRSQRARTECGAESQDRWPRRRARKCCSRAAGRLRKARPTAWPPMAGFVVTGGVIGWDTQGHLAPDFVAQVRQTLSNIAEILAAGRRQPSASRAPDLVCRRHRGISRQPEGTRPRLSRDFWRALSGDGAGAGGAPGREGSARVPRSRRRRWYRAEIW